MHARASLRMKIAQLGRADNVTVWAHSVVPSAAAISQSVLVTTIITGLCTAVECYVCDNNFYQNPSPSFAYNITKSSMLTTEMNGLQYWLTTDAWVPAVDFKRG